MSSPYRPDFVEVLDAPGPRLHGRCPLCTRAVVDLPTAESLTAFVAQTKATRAEIIELLDCELSYGTIRSGRVPWEVRFWTLPWREGKPLDFAQAIALDAAGAPVPRGHIEGWSVAINTFTPDDLRVLFPR